MLTKTITVSGIKITQWSLDGVQWHMDHGFLDKPRPLDVTNEPMPAPQERPIGMIRNRQILTKRRGKRKLVRLGEQLTLHKKHQLDDAAASRRAASPRHAVLAMMRNPTGPLWTNSEHSLATRVSRGVFYEHTGDPIIRSF